MPNATRRTTKYVELIQEALDDLGHATNAQLVSRLRQVYPDVSATTIHRITQRFVEDGRAQHAPNTATGAKLFDANIVAHDHFECAGCGELRDITIPNHQRTVIRDAIGDCRVDGPLKIVGTCCNCMNTT
ncbi:MAG TPA: transcriptional repressor [Patescibacteria group bacterium]|nr:transcriptional repressor [Patescibacteria group bacterium]